MKRVVFASLFALLIIAAIVFAYFYYQQLKSPASESFAAIPTDAALVIEIKKVSGLWEKILQTDSWASLSKQPVLSKISLQAQFLDSAMAANKDINALFQNKPLVISVHVSKSTDFDFLYLVNVPRFNQEGLVNGIIANLTGPQADIKKRNYNGAVIREVTLPGTGQTFAYTVSKGLFMGSKSSVLIEDAVRQLKSGTSLRNDKNFRRVYESAGKNVDAAIMVNYRNMGKLAGVFASDNASGVLGALPAFSQWGEFDVKIKPEGVSLNGFTSPSDSSHFLSAFSNQQPVSTDLINYIPRRVAVFQYFGQSDFQSYYSKLWSFISTRDKASARAEYFTQLDKLTGANTKEKMLAWIGSAQIYFITETNSASYANNAFAMIKTADAALARTSLKQLAETIARKKGTGYKEELYKGRIIGFVNHPSLLPNLLGPVYSHIDKFFYTMVDDVVIIGNQASSVRGYIDDISTGKTLISEPAYKDLQQGLSSSCNYYAYVNYTRAAYIIRSMSNNNTIEFLSANGSYFDKLDAIATQFSANGNLMFNNLYFHYGTTKVSKGEVNALWATQLDTACALPPNIVINHNNAQHEIMVQDVAGNLYLIDASGEVIWKRKIPEQMLGEVHQVDLFKNGKLQYLFNTQSKLYMIDRNANDVGNFPIRLPAKATTALSIFDYDKNLDYRIFVPCENGQVYTYQANGKPLIGWQLTEPLGFVNNPIQHFNADGKDYLVLSDTNGKLLVLDRRGEIKSKSTLPVVRPDNSRLFIQQDASKRVYFVTTDTAGTLYSIFADGNTLTKAVGSHSSYHKFIFRDINADGEEDYIFMDDNRLEAYRRDNTLIFSKAFDREMLNDIDLFIFSTGRGKIGVVSPPLNETYLINDDGSVYSGFPLKGSARFVIDDLNNDGSRKVITTSLDGNVYVYNLD